MVASLIYQAPAAIKIMRTLPWRPLTSSGAPARSTCAPGSL